MPKLNADGSQKKVNGIVDILALAKNRPDLAKRTADAFGWFAFAM